MRKIFLPSRLLILAAATFSQFVDFAHAQEISTRVLGIAVLNPGDDGYKADRKAFENLIKRRIPSTFQGQSIIRETIVIDVPIANGDWKRDVKKPVEEFLNSFGTPRNATTVFFHFGGHGGTQLAGGPPGKRETAILSFQRKGGAPTVAREEVFQWLENQGCRTTVFVTDTCTIAGVGPRPVKFLPGGEPAALDLLLRFAGTVDIRSASYRDPANNAKILNEEAFSDNFGGLFSRLFYGQLGEDWPAGAAKSWQGFGATCAEDLRLAFTPFKATHPIVPASQTSQTAQFIVR
jgi:hypothetical protein